MLPPGDPESTSTSRPRRVAPGSFEELRVGFIHASAGVIFISCVIFGITRGLAEFNGAGKTPWWANIGMALLVAGTWAWFRRDPFPRANISVQILAGAALAALAVPVAYGMGSSIWWMSLVPFSLILLGSRGEAIAWTVVTIGVVVALAAISDEIQVPGAAGEGGIEALLARVMFAVVLLALALRFREGTEQHANELDVARRQAEASSRAKTNFLAHMSHELRTPLNGIISMLDLTRRDAPKPEHRAHLHTAMTSAQLLLRLIQDVLDAAHMESGSLELHEAPFSLHLAVGDAVRTVHEKAAAKGLTVTASAAPEMHEWWLGDGLRVSQIVLNLVGNSVKFTDEGEVRVKLRDEAGAIVIEVSDTGRGIAEPELDAIWEPFVQVGARVVNEPGTGLGLAITRELAERMGGEVRVSSALGQGTRFEVRLPLAPAPGRPGIGPESLLKSDSALITPSGGEIETDDARAHCHVLVADDDATNRLVADRILTTLGYEVSTAVDGLDALEAFEERPADIVLVDLEMPRMDGLELMRSLRNRGVEAPLIAVSAHADGASRQSASRAGADDYVVKPYTIHELERALARSREADEGPDTDRTPA